MAIIDLNLPPADGDPLDPIEAPSLEDEQAAAMGDVQAATQEVCHHFDLNIPVFEEHEEIHGAEVHTLDHDDEDYGVYAGDVNVVFEEKKLDDSEESNQCAHFQMESTGAHRMEDMPSDGLQRRGRRWRRRPRRTEAKTIRVENLLGHGTFSLELDLSETIAKVKAMIYEQEGTHPTQQVLIFRQQQLNDDHRTLADYGVQHGPSSSLVLVTRLHGGDPPEKEGTGSHCMEAMASEEVWRCSQGAKTILVKTLTGQITKLEEVDLSETIEGVKDMISEKTGDPPTSQRLIFNGVEARKEWYTLEDYGFQYGTAIMLVRRLRGGGGPDPEINIFVTKLDGETFTLRLWSLTDTDIHEVRRMIRVQKGIRQTQQHLVFRGQPLDDDKTLADYNIQENSTLHLAPGPCGGNSGLHEDRKRRPERGMIGSSKISHETFSYYSKISTKSKMQRSEDPESENSTPVEKTKYPSRTSDKSIGKASLAHWEIIAKEGKKNGA